MVCAHCGHYHRTGNSPNFCKLCQVVGHRQKTANCQFHVCSKCNTVGHSARACKAPQLQQQMVRGEREPEHEHSESGAPMATDGDMHADEDDDERDQLNRTSDHEPDDNTSNDDADADIDVNDHSDKMTTMMLSKYISSAMILCANRAGTLAIVRIEITDVQTTTALTAKSRDTGRGLARMCSARTAIFLVT